jgi:hypothetical protein
MNGYRRHNGNLKGTDMAERITFQELEDKLRDIDTPDEELVPYFTGDPKASKPFQPILKPNPATVETTPVDEFRIEGAFAMDWANGIRPLAPPAAFPARCRPQGQADPGLGR